MTKTDSRMAGRSLWRSASQLAVSVEDRFRFTLVVCFIGLGLIGTGGLFYLSDERAQKFNTEAADIAVTRWMANSQGRYGQWFIPMGSDFSEINAPAILEPNRLIPRSLLPDSISRQDIAITNQLNGDPVWVVSKHPLLDKGISLVLSEREFPELRIARESLLFQRWLVVTLLLVLLGACAAFFLFNKHYIFRPLSMLREALLNRRLTEAARVKHSPKAKIIIERLEERSRFPLEQFDVDEFGQIAFILEDQDKRQKTLRLDWLKSFNTITEPVAIFSNDDKLCHMNTAMEELLDELGISSDLVSGLGSQPFIGSFLQLDETIANRLHQVLNQSYPRVCAQTCNMEFPDGQRTFRYSIATISNHGERFAVFSLIRDQVLGQNQSLEDVILEQTNNQLKVIHKIQAAVKESPSAKDDTISHLCEQMVDNIHSLLEITNSIHSSYAAHKLEFNVQHFFRDLQESLEGVFQLNIEFERHLPNFIVGDPTHLRQFLKGIFQSCHETSSINQLLLTISYNSVSKELMISICSNDGSPVLRDPTVNLFIAHYSPFLSIRSTDADELQSDEFVRVSLAAPAGINRIESLDLDLSNRQLPSTLLIVSDELIPEEARTVLAESDQLNCEWLTPGEILDKNLSVPGLCMILFINNSQKLREKQIQKVINHARAHKLPSILLSQQPRRGESLTAQRLGFITYLSMPIEQDELHKLLILTMNKAVRDSVGKLGLLTKHTVRDIIPSLGKVLLGNITKEHQGIAEKLSKTLKTMGFRVSEANTVHSFFELLHKGNFEYILCPNELSTGLKRRIQVSLKGTPCVVFGESAKDETIKLEEGKNSGQATQISWINIEDPTNTTAIKLAFEFATAHELTQPEGKIQADSDDNEAASVKKSNFDLAI